MSTPDPDLYSTRPPSTAPEYDLATQVDREARAADSTGDGFSNTESFAPPTQYATSTTDVAASTVAARASSSRPTIGLELSEAVGKGGMGIVYQAKDFAFGRPLACKALLLKHAHRADLRRRFLAEAKVQALLQHPGIVPVHELGELPDGRPYFSMKLVEGRDLESLLSERPSPRHDLPRFLAVFEQVCLTMAYAHDKKIIHRDLKPANIMVGAYGEVQVMDWGLAKCLGETTPQQEASQETDSGHVDAEDEVLSQAGEVMGTLAYMAPEQARGEIDRIDQRADVFALGAILSVILSGKPAFVMAMGTTTLLEQAKKGEVGPAAARLQECGADRELVALACRCLAVDPADRPADARVVAKALDEYQAGVRERLRQAEVEAEAQRVRAEGERRARRLQLSLAGSLLVLALLGGGVWTYLAWQKQMRLAAFERSLSAIDALLGHARLTPHDPSPWREAKAALVPIRSDATGASLSQPLLDRLQEVEQDVEAGLDRASRLSELLADLLEVRAAQQDLGPEGTESAYKKVFRKANLDVDGVDPVARFLDLPQDLKLQIAGYLDHWSSIRQSSLSKRGDASMRRTLVELAIALDPDEGRARLRRELSGAVTGEALVKLVQEIKLDGLPAATAVLAASRLVEARKGEEAALLLERAVRDHPQDLWINYTLARAEESRVHARLEEALRYYSAARAIRPETAHEQAHLLCRMGRDQEAFSIFEDLDHRNPHDVINLSCYGELMSERGDRAEGEQILSRAVEAGKMKVGLNPNDADAHVNLGNAFKFQGSLAEAEVEYREVARLKPNNAAAHFTLGDTLDKQKKLDEAIVEYREAVRLDPDYVEARVSLGNALKARDLLDEALAAYRQAERRVQPGTPSAAQLPKLIEKTEQAIKYGRRLPLVLAGTDRPKTAEEAAAFAEFCNAEARHGDAVKLWRNAFKDYPALASSRTSQSRYKAASSAVLAGCGDSQDDPKLDEAARADLRKQARTWLAAELDAWEALIKQTPQRKASVSQTLRNWRTDPNLAGIRDDAGLAKLPVAERSQCKALWARVAAILNPSAKP